MTSIETLHFEVAPDVDPAELVYTFGGVEPRVQIKPGTLVSTSTLDCFAGQITRQGMKPSEHLDPRYLNPQTGPFYVEGAEPGDTLAVHFVSIDRKSTRLNSSHVAISYAVFCLKKKTKPP